MLAYLKGLSTLVQAAIAAALLAALVFAVWFAVVKPRSDLAAEKLDHAETKAHYAKVLADIAEKTAAVEAAAKVAVDAYNTNEEDSKREKADAVAKALAEGKRLGFDIGAGSVILRPQWRSGCPAAPAGAGAEPDEGAAADAESRAAGIGRVYGIAGVGDATYEEAYRRLKNLQPVIDQCFENPHEP